MQRINLSVALSVSLLFVGSSFAMQRGGQGRAGASAPRVVSGNRSLGNGASANSGVNQKSVGHQTSHSENAANPRDTHGFKNYGQYVAAQHVSEHLGISLDELRGKMTGANAQSLGKAIQDITGIPETEANAEAKKAEQASKKDTGK
jgi:hypothetical protein